MSLAALTEWLGSGGKPVLPNEAERRAAICVTCDSNVQPLWWERFFKDPIAMAIKRQLEVKNEMQLKVSIEDELGMCKACGCCIKLKIFSPMVHIQAHLKPEELAKMPSFCWIRTETL